jgi:glycosyltransferase involved in cell wall biosynthesis
MKILWLSNLLLSDKDCAGTGSWLYAMSKKLIDSGKITLGNIAVGPVKSLLRQDYNEVNQWIVPKSDKSGKDGLPSNSLISELVLAVKDFSPDLIHVWGVEGYWGLLTARGILNYSTLLEIQGLKGVYSHVFSGGLNFRECLLCIGAKEILRQSTIFHEKNKFKKWGRFEAEIISKHSNITTQSPWVEAWVKNYNPCSKVFHTELILREPFYEQMPWKSVQEPVVFCSSAYPSPYKGLHDAIRAIGILRNRFPRIKLKIAGAHQKGLLRQDGYIRWINRMIVKNKLTENIDWLGPLTADKVAQEMVKCSVVLMPSHCETYCVAFAEAMQLGLPLVTTYTGGTAWLAKDEESALFFSPGDEVMCAYQLERVLTNPELASRLSEKAREIAATRNDPLKIVANQLEIYFKCIK